jgi:NADPH2:quinone reductase
VAATTKQAYGGFAEYAVCPAVATFAVPDSIPLPDAAAVYFPFHLAWLGLFDRAGLLAGETVLIHAAAGGSGSIAVQMARAAGATVIATASTEDKRALCLSLGADHVVDYTVEGWAATVLELTGGRGVDVVFDNVGEAVWEPSLTCTAYNGRYVMMGFASNKAVADEPFIVPRRVMLANIRLCGVLFNYADPAMVGFLKSAMGWNVATREVGDRVHAAVIDMVESGAVRPIVGEVIGFEDIPARLEAMESRATIGRVIALLPRP